MRLKKIKCCCSKLLFLSHSSIYYMCKSKKQQYKNNEFKIIAPIWNHEFELCGGSYSVSDIQVYIKYI